MVCYKYSLHGFLSSADFFSKLSFQKNILGIPSERPYNDMSQIVNILNALHAFCRLLIFFKINIFKKIFQENHLSIKQFGP